MNNWRNEILVEYASRVVVEASDCGSMSEVSCSSLRQSKAFRKILRFVHSSIHWYFKALKNV